jgi:cell division protein ZapA (FtsZ GTPase activity inhibitor)
MNAYMMYRGEGITVSLAGLPIHVDCEPEHADYCLHLTSKIEPRAQAILKAAPDISLTELLFLLALSLADEIHGPSERRARQALPTDADVCLENGGRVSPEERALTSLFQRLRG